MECPICLVSDTKHSLSCGHSFCYKCITRWYIEYQNCTCPMCRTQIEFVSKDNTRHIYVQCVPHTNIEHYINFQNLREEYRYSKYDIKEVEYLSSRTWVEWVIEHKAKTVDFTIYTFYGLQGTKEACHKERQKDKQTSIFTKAYKD